MLRRSIALLSIGLLAACSATAPASSTSPSPGMPSSASAGNPGLGAALPACIQATTWRCGTVSVRLAPVDPAGPTIDIHYYVLPRTDASRTPLEPVFISPGGPGGSIWADHDALPIDAWDARHDTVLVDPRGVGASGALTCPALDRWLAGGMVPISDESSQVAACATSLGSNAGWYGSVERASDLEAVRSALGIDAIDDVGGSAASVDAQAYAVRYPEHLHALVLDSPFPATWAGNGGWEVGYPAMLLRVIARQCARTPDCESAFPDPVALLTKLVQAIRAKPIRDPGAPGAASGVVADEAAIAAILLGGDPASTKPLLAAASSALDGGDPVPLLQLVASTAPQPGAPPDPAAFSWADNLAVTCTDHEHPWAAGMPIAGRPAALQASLAALPAEAFAPFSHEGWLAADRGLIEQCLAWPPDARVERSVPADAAYPAVPTLVLAGDLDTGSPVEYGQRVASLFPDATFVVVTGAGHIAEASSWGTCGGTLVDTFLDTLKADPAACSGG